MPRPRLDLEPHKAEIIELIPNTTHNGIRDHLKNKHGIDISRTTLKDRLRAWDLLKPQPNIQNRIHERVKELLPLYGTKEILKILADEGTPSSSRTLERIRRRLGVSLRLTPEKRKEQLNIEAILEAKAAIGELETINRQNVYHHLRSKGLFYTEAQVRLICKCLRPPDQRRLTNGKETRKRRKKNDAPQDSNDANGKEGETQQHSMAQQQDMAQQRGMGLQMALPGLPAFFGL